VQLQIAQPASRLVQTCTFDHAGTSIAADSEGSPDIYTLCNHPNCAAHASRACPHLQLHTKILSGLLSVAVHFPAAGAHDQVWLRIVL